jgi:hypothetical protein
MPTLTPPPIVIREQDEERVTEIDTLFRAYTPIPDTVILGYMREEDKYLISERESTHITGLSAFSTPKFLREYVQFRMPTLVSDIDAKKVDFREAVSIAKDRNLIVIYLMDDVCNVVPYYI